MRKTIIIIFCFLAIFCGNVNAQLVKDVIDVPLKDTPFLDFVNQEEDRYLSAFPFLLIELKKDMSFEVLEKLLKLVKEKDFSVCLDAEDDIKTYCKLYFTLSLMGTDSSDLEQFLEPPFSEIATLGRMIYFLKNADYEGAKRVSGLISDRAIRTYFRALFDLVALKLEKGDLDSLELLENQAKIFLLYSLGKEAVEDLLVKERLPATLYFIVGKTLFRKGDYKRAGDAFLYAANYKRFKETALKNAFYAYLNANDFASAREIVTYLGEGGYVLEAMLTLSQKGRVRIEGYFLKDQIFIDFLLAYAKNSLMHGRSIDFLSKIEEPLPNEELMFLTAISKLIYQGKMEFSNYFEKNEWKEEVYLMALKEFQKGKIKHDSGEKLIRQYNLFKYYPFNYFYANAIKDSNDLLAEKIYENIIKRGKNVPKDVLYECYVNLAEIFKKRGKYYTAIKVLEDALNLAKNEEEILMEIIRLYALKEDWEEVKWRAERLMEETKNTNYKKELQFFIDLCYEKLDKVGKESK